MYSKGDMFVISESTWDSEKLSKGTVVVLALDDTSSSPFFMEVYEYVPDGDYRDDYYRCQFNGGAGAWITYSRLTYLGYSYSEWKADNKPSDNATEIHKQSHFISPLEISPAGINISLPEGIDEATVRWNANGVNITWENPKEEN